MIDKRWPKKLNDQDKAELQLMLGEATHAQQIELLKIGTQEQLRFDERIMSLEGTASDLKAAGWPGRLVLFLRGAQRPAWGFFTLYMDFMVFSGAWKLPEGADPGTGMTMQSAFWIINALVLAFLFGERGLKNILPLISRLQSERKG